MKRGKEYKQVHTNKGEKGTQNKQEREERGRKDKDYKI